MVKMKNRNLRENFTPKKCGIALALEFLAAAVLLFSCVPVAKQTHYLKEIISPSNKNPQQRYGFLRSRYYRSVMYIS